MRTESYKGILLSILITVSLMAPVITTISLLSVSPVSAAGSYENIVIGGDTAYTIDGDATPPWLWYGPDQPGGRPPIMAAKRVGSGAVVAAGLAHTLRNGRWNDFTNTLPHLDVLLDNAFRWMTGKAPSATKVLWYGEYNIGFELIENLYNDAAGCSALVAALRTKGFTVDNTRNAVFDNITPGLLAPYDILVIPQFQFGAVGAIGPGTGGDPDLLPDSVVETIVSFVQAGGGLLIMDGSDTYQHNYCWVNDKVLRALDMGIYFQSDAVYDDVNNWYGNWGIFPDVDNTTWIGSAYENATGSTKIGVYMASSLAVRDNYEIGASISPTYQSAFPNTTITYTLSAMALGWNRDTLILSVENVWPATLGTDRFENVGTEGETTTLTVTIPPGTALGDEDEIKVTITSDNEPTKTMDMKCTAIASMRIGPPIEDTYTTQVPVEIGADWTDPRGGFLWMHVGSSLDNNKRTYLKFDLSGIPEGLIPPDDVQIDDIRARLFLWCEILPTGAAAGKNVNIYEVNNDGWDETTMYWGYGEPENGALIDTTKVTEGGYWYSWDVTAHVIDEFRNDNIASFSLRAETENSVYPDDFGYYSFTSTSSIETWEHPYLIIGYDVSTWISPDYDGLPDGTLTYNVNVWNRGSETDNYDLYIENVWETTLETPILNVEPMETRTAELTVKIPAGAADGENDIILVTVVSEHSGENDNGVCIARAWTNVSSWEDSSTMGSDDPPHHLENSVWGRATGIFVGRDYGGAAERGWLKFDLRAFPAGTTVTRANLYLNSYSTYGADVRVYGVGDDSWSEYTIKWTDKPSIDADNALDTRAVIENDKWYSWDVTDFVASEYVGDKKVSFCLVDIGESVAPDHDARFSSKEWGDNVPYLEILAAAPENEVRAYVDPIFQGGLVGDTLTYTITVMNKGTLDDNYDLTVENTETWSLTLDNSTLEVPAGENRTTTLNVTIPSGDFGTINDITITVTAQNPKKDKIRVKAHRSKATIGLENLYAVSLDINALLRDDASKLVLKFYDYGFSPKGENVVWSTMPARLISVNAFPDPQAASGMQETKLVLTDEVGATIQTLSTFTVWKVDLEDRFMWIPYYWSSATPAGKLDLESEFMWIPFYWSAAPPW